MGQVKPYSTTTGVLPRRDIARSEFRQIAHQCGWQPKVIDLLLAKDTVYGKSIVVPPFQINGEIVTLRN